MASSTRSAGAGANEDFGGGDDWSNPGNITASDDSNATANISTFNGFTDYLKASSFGFSIPSGATIDGIVVEVERRSGGVDRTKDYRVRIVKGGTVGSTDKADTTNWWPEGTDAYASYGSATDLWGETWTTSDINASNFGAVIAANNPSQTGFVFVDHIRITVHYTESVPATVTPAAVAASSAVPASTFTAAASQAPAVISRSLAVPQASASAGASRSPDAIAAPASIGAAAAQGHVTPLPAVSALQAGIPAATLQAGAQQSPGAIAVTTAMPQAAAEGAPSLSQTVHIGAP